jgi:membrane protease YdiL (CAAX protease family)
MTRHEAKKITGLVSAPQVGREKRLTVFSAGSFFISFTIYFYVLLYTFLPFVKLHTKFNPAVYWFITGYALFVPLFAFSIILVRREGSTTIARILEALYLRRLTASEIKYSFIGLAVVIATTAAIFSGFMLLNRLWDVRMPDTTPWFMEMRPFQGAERWLLLMWLPMFFFNIVGEELLWRGYIQARLAHKQAWVLCSALWLLFHLAFGLDLLIVLLPVIIVIPYVFAKTGNTGTGILIHGLFNGPMFVAVALGWVG